jgi:hypothetical protein
VRSGPLPEGRAKPDHVAVRVDDRTFTLSPIRGLRRLHIDTGRSPFDRQGVSVIDEQVRRADTAIVRGDDTEVNFDPCHDAKP